jgi:hypothetical protein
VFGGVLRHVRRTAHDQKINQKDIFLLPSSNENSKEGRLPPNTLEEVADTAT